MRAIRDAATATPRLSLIRRPTLAQRLLADAERDAAGGRPEPTQEQVKLSERIDNWKRALRWYRINQLSKSQSLEGNYRPPRGVEFEYTNGDPPPRPPLSVDLFDAWEVELAWRSLHLKARLVLKLHHHSELKPVTACRLMRNGRVGTLPQGTINLRPEDWDDHLRSAHFDLQSELVRRQRNLLRGKVPIPVDFYGWLVQNRVTTTWSIKNAVPAD